MTTWIFLRGLTREIGHWGNFLPAFKHIAPGSHVIALDLPGNGALHWQRSPMRVRELVESCRTQLVAQAIAPPYHLLAMSLGAMVAVCWGNVYPAEVAANVLINTSMRPFSAFYQRLKPANYATLMKLMCLGATPQEWEKTILSMTTANAPANVVPHWLALRRMHPVSRVNALRQLIAAARFRAPPGRPKTPTLLLASEADRLVSATCSKKLAQHWQCTLRLHPSAGHDLPLDDGLWALEQIRQWLADTPRSA